MIKRWIYELVVEIDGDERDALGVSPEDEQNEVLAAIHALPFVRDVEMQYAITQELLHCLSGQEEIKE